MLCTGYKNVTFIDLKKLFLPKKVETFMMGIKQKKNNNLKIKNLLPKDEEFSHLEAKGKIVITKDVDFDILCFEIDIDNYFLTLVRLWPQNCLSQPLTPVASSDDIEFDAVN